MPNTPLMLGEGATELVKNAAASADQLAAVRALFDTMGVTVTFQEETMLNEVIPYAWVGARIHLCFCRRHGEERRGARHCL